MCSLSKPTLTHGTNNTPSLWQKSDGMSRYQCLLTQRSVRFVRLSTQCLHVLSFVGCAAPPVFLALSLFLALRVDGLLEEATKQLEAWGKQVAASHADGQAKQSHIVDLEAQRDGLTQQVQSLTAESDKQRGIIQELQRTLDDSQAAVRQLTSDKSAVETALERQTSEAKASAEQARASADAFEKLREQLSGYRSQLDKFQVNATTVMCCPMCAILG